MTVIYVIGAIMTVILLILVSIIEEDDQDPYL